MCNRTKTSLTSLLVYLEKRLQMRMRVNSWFNFFCTITFVSGVNTACNFSFISAFVIVLQLTIANFQDLWQF